MDSTNNAKKKRRVDIPPGFLAFDITGLPDFDYDALARAMQAWFVQQLKKPLKFRLTSFLSQEPLDFTKPAHLYALFCRYKEHLKEDSAAVCRAAWNGNVNAQGAPYAGLCQSGFGWPAHIRALKVTRAIPLVLERASQEFGQRVYLGGPGHLIWKIPHDTAGKLQWHNDSGSAETALATALNSRTMTDMGNAFGWQSLVHLRGEAGPTLFLKYMTPARQALIFLLLLPGNEYAGIKGTLKGENVTEDPDRVVAEFPPGFDASLLKMTTKAPWQACGGPVFFNHQINLEVYNLVIKMFQEGDIPEPRWIAAVGNANMAFLRAKFAQEAPHNPPLEVAPMIPEHHQAGAPYAIFWPKTAIHAAAATGPDEPRLTMTLKASLKPNVMPERAIQRLRLLAEWPSATPERRAEIETWLNKDAPYCGGIVHRDMKRESLMLPYFGHLYASSEDVAELLMFC